MKNIPLVLKIWLVFASLTLSLFMLLAFSLPWTLKGFFTEQIYDILLDSQKAVPKDVIRVNLSPNNAAYAIPAVPSQVVAAPNAKDSVPGTGTAPTTGSGLITLPSIQQQQMAIPTEPIDMNAIRKKVELFLPLAVRVRRK